MRVTEAHPTWSKSLAGPVAGLVALWSVGVIPLDLDAKLVRHAVSKTPDTASTLTIKESVSSQEILRALANVHDVMLNSSVDLEDAARAVLYAELWNLYE